MCTPRSAASCLGSVVRLVLVCIVLVSSGRAWALPEGGVDLHAHLSMKPALGPLFQGSIDAPLQADSWDDRLSSKLNAAALDASGLSLVVVALFAHPLLGGDMRAQVRVQIDEVQAFVRAHPRWAIARDAAEARALLDAGRRVLVLSLEGASGVLESEEDLVEFVDGRGVRIVTPLHMVDDRYGGAAILPGFSYFGNPLGAVAGLLDARRGIDLRARGLTPIGRRLITQLVARGVWIDLTHASDAAVAEIVPIVRAADQPLLVTHAMLRRHRPVERAASDELLKAVAASGGVVGLLPSEDAFDSPAGRVCPPGCAVEACKHGANAFAAVWADAVRLVGGAAVMLGSDLHGVVLGGASLRVGSVFGAHEGFSISLYGGGGADVALLPAPPGGDAGYLSQMVALGGVRTAQQAGRFFQGFEARLWGVRESHAGPRWLSTPHYRGFAGASF